MLGKNDSRRHFEKTDLTDPIFLTKLEKISSVCRLLSLPIAWLVLKNWRGLKLAKEQMHEPGVRSQFVLKSIRSHFGQFVLKFFFLGQFVLLCSTCTHLSIRPHFGQFILMLN